MGAGFGAFVGKHDPAHKFMSDFVAACLELARDAGLPGKGEEL